MRGNVLGGVSLLAALRGEGDLITEAEAGGGVSRGGGGRSSAGHGARWTAAVPRRSVRARSERDGG